MRQRLVYLHGGKEDSDVEHIMFPTGEQHIRIRGLSKATDVTCVRGLEDIVEPMYDQVVLVYNDSSGGIMKLGMAVDICRRAGVQSIILVMPFVPYARQDEVYVEGDPLSISVFAEFVNSLNFDQVIITDPHSKVTSALINNALVIQQHETAMQAVLELDQHITDPIRLVAPDLGAAQKIKKLQKHLRHVHGLKFDIIQCDKTRCPDTGKITGFKVLDGDPFDAHCLMVDDICDGGGTFLGLGDVLDEQGAVGQSLYVTHGIFSKGVKILKRRFEYIFTTDSLPSTSLSVHVIKLGAYT